MRSQSNTCILLSLVAGAAASALAGPVTPPAGPVGSTYKTIAEVEPRIAVNAANTPGNGSAVRVISQPGSYYLTENIVGVSGRDGIVIAASNVTLDLNGFAVIGVAGAYAGVAVEAGEGCTVRNGTVSGWGAGVYSVRNGCTFEGLTFVGNTGHGLSCGNATRIVGCIAKSNGGTGFAAGDNCTVSGCTASQNTGVGISVNHGGRVIDCQATGNSTGITTYSTGFVTGCISRQNGQDGVGAGVGTTVSRCHVVDNGDDGVQASSDCVISGNTFDSNGPLGAGAGVYVTGTECRIEENQLRGNKYGVLAQNASGNNFIVRNTARNNSGGNFNVHAANDLAPVITNPGSTFTGATPWSNFAY